MNILEWRHLQAEKRALDETLARLSQRASRALRQPLEQRRDRITARLAEDPDWDVDAAVGFVSFSGNPVRGDYGIDMEFAGQALQHFGNTIVALSGKRAAPILTKVVPGSYGFQIESGEPQTSLLNRMSPTVVAFDNIIQAMVAISSQHDESVAIAFVDFNRSAMTSFRRFVSVLAENEALCSVETGSNSFRFSSVDKVHQVATLMESRVEEGEESWTGRFKGFLPDRLWGEFVPDGSTDSLLVRIALEEGEELPDDVNRLVSRQVMLWLQRRRVGASRPRYTATRWEFLGTT